VVVGSPVHVTGSRWIVRDLAEGDDPRRATIDAQSTPGADVVVDDEDGRVHGVYPWELGPHGFIDCAGGKQKDALPRADVDTALADDALGLVDVDELFRLDRRCQIVGINSLKDVVIAKVRKRRVCVGLGHDQLSLTRGRP